MCWKYGESKTKRMNGYLGINNVLIAMIMIIQNVVTQMYMLIHRPFAQ